MAITPNAPANFTPEMGNTSYTGYSGQGSFRFWCQKVLPLVYDDSLSYYETLCKVVAYLNNVISDISSLEGNFEELDTVTKANVDKLLNAYNELQGYVNDYFSTLDVQEEINKKLDEMAEDGTLSALIQPMFDEYKKEIDEEVTEQKQKITVLEARMGTFASLPDGSTAGDAELTDIRVDFTGKTWPSAGDSVRGVTSEMLVYRIPNPSDFNKKIAAINYPFMSNMQAIAWDDLPSGVSQAVVVNVKGSNPDIYLQLAYDWGTWRCYMRVTQSAEALGDWKILGNADLKVLENEVIRYTYPSETTFENTIAKINYPFMCNMIAANWPDMPENVTQGVVVNVKGISPDTFMQLCYDYMNTNTYMRVTQGGVATSEWVNVNRNILDNINDNIIKFKYLNTDDYSRLLEKVDIPVMVNVESRMWDDIPSGTTQGVLFNVKGSTPNIYSQMFIDWPNSRLYNRVTSAGSKVTDWQLLNNTAKTFNKKIGCLGDSITLGPSGGSWVELMKPMLYTSTIINYGVSGEGVQQMNARLDNLDSDLDYLTVWGGVNNFLWDSIDVNAFKNQYEILIKNVLSKFPDAKILAMTPMKFKITRTLANGAKSPYWDTARSDGSKLVDYVNAELEILDKYAVPRINMFNESSFTPDIEQREIYYVGGDDLLHPSSKGKSVLANIIASKLLTI